MDRVAAFSALQLHTVEGDKTHCFSGGAKTQCHTSSPFTCITSDKDFVVGRVLMVNDCQAVSTYN